MYTLVQIQGFWFKYPVKRRSGINPIIASADVLQYSDFVYSPTSKTFVKQRHHNKYTADQIDMLIFARGGIEAFPEPPLKDFGLIDFGKINRMQFEAEADPNELSNYGITYESTSTAF